jgi:hypothetical protein
MASTRLAKTLSMHAKCWPTHVSDCRTFTYFVQVYSVEWSPDGFSDKNNSLWRHAERYGTCSTFGDTENDIDLLTCRVLGTCNMRLVHCLDLYSQWKSHYKFEFTFLLMYWLSNVHRNLCLGMTRVIICFAGCSANAVVRVWLYVRPIRMCTDLLLYFCGRFLQYTTNALLGE